MVQVGRVERQQQPHRGSKVEKSKQLTGSEKQLVLESTHADLPDGLVEHINFGQEGGLDSGLFGQRPVVQRLELALEFWLFRPESAALLLGSGQLGGRFGVVHVRHDVLRGRWWWWWWWWWSGGRFGVGYGTTVRGLDTELAVMLQKSRIQWYRSRLPLGKVVDKSGKAAIVWQAGEE